MKAAKQSHQMQLVPASQLTLSEVTEAYNQTRIDYVVPMPMNVARLREYVEVYSVDMNRSWIAQNGTAIYGLGMLGVRQARAWITRLGVLPNGRRKGTGLRLMEGLIERAEEGGATAVWLEVIKGNKPAHELFKKLGFVETRELIVARRAPSPTATDRQAHISHVRKVDHQEALDLLSHRQKRPNWLNETESFQNVPSLSGLMVDTHEGGRGWVVYEPGLLQLKRVQVEVVDGDETAVTHATLTALHSQHKQQDALTENLFDEAQWRGYQQAGYFESFRRIEMVRT